ncbi:hypothetical protein B296_00053306 [Ensete ventricosum]|uniref:Uncharacterized protein n=1 Tax=Ensete ventricosum TaxID=4639 RepID=A0A426Y8Q6_ENSVE|nr:hypothetical protein B296_00053306 [Ensete ventricosum]
MLLKDLKKTDRASINKRIKSRKVCKIPLVGCIQLEDALTIIRPQQLVRKGKDARGLPGARRALEPEMMRSIEAKIIAWFEGFYALGEASERSKMELTERMRLGMLPSRAMTSSREMASPLPTMSETLDGRYFSTQGTSYELEEEEEAMDFGRLAGKRRRRQGSVRGSQKPLSGNLSLSCFLYTARFLMLLRVVKQSVGHNDKISNNSYIIVY